MSRRIRRHQAFLNFVCSADSDQRESMVRLSTDEQLNAINEITLNLYMGNPTVSETYKSKLRPHKKIIQSLSDRGIDNSKKRRLLVKHNHIVPLLLKPYFKHNGRRICTRQEDDIRSTEEQIKQPRNPTETNSEQSNESEQHD